MYFFLLLDKKFKFAKNYDTRNVNKNILTTITNDDNFTEASHKNFINAGITEINKKDETMSSNLSEDEFNCDELLATYDKAKEEIKKNSGDRKKLQALKFNTENNKIVSHYDSLSKKKLFPDEVEIIPEDVRENIINKIPAAEKITRETLNSPSEDSSEVVISLDDYSLNFREDNFKNNFLNYNRNPLKSKNEFL
jgi:hypothetical protein